MTLPSLDEMEELFNKKKKLQRARLKAARSGDRDEELTLMRELNNVLAIIKTKKLQAKNHFKEVQWVLDCYDKNGKLVSAVSLRTGDAKEALVRFADCTLGDVEKVVKMEINQDTHPLFKAVSGS